MGRKKETLAGYAQKQKLLYAREDVPAQVLIEHGDRFLETDQLYDAIEFYCKANHEPGLARLREMLIAKGDTFLFQFMLRKSKQEASSEEWNRLAASALEHGKRTYAEDAYRSAGNWNELHKLRGKPPKKN